MWVTRIFGFIITMLGLLFTLTIIGAVLGIPMMIVGSIMVAVSFFGSRKTTITNVIHVASGPYPGTPTPPSPLAHPVPEQRAIATKPARPSLEPATRVPQQVATGEFCSECGAAVVDVGSAFCANCGNKL